MNPENTAPASDPSEETAPHFEKPRRRLLRVIALTSAGLILIALAATSLLWWWAGTNGSLATALRWVGQSQPLTATHATGSLRAGGHIDQLMWQQEGLAIEVQDIHLAWQPWALLQGTLQFNRLTAASVHINDQRGPRPRTQPPAALSLPVAVALETFSIAQLQWSGTAAFSASGISGHYAFNRFQHRLDLLNAQIASGRYSGHAVLAAHSPLMLEANLSGALSTTLPNSTHALPLIFKATVRGPITQLLATAALQINATAVAGRMASAAAPQASISAHITPWAEQPLPQADARFSNLDLAALWPAAPHTLLTGNATVRPDEAVPSTAWLLNLQLANGLPGPWDKQRLPLERLQAKGEWRQGVAIVRTLQVQGAGAELMASGEWTHAVPAAWKLDATLKHLNPALLHSQFAPQALEGRAAVRSQAEAIGFNASLEASPTSPNTPDKSVNASAKSLRLRDASTTGSWNPSQAGGTLVLSALRLRANDAQLAGQLEIQPAARGGKGKLALTAPGLSAQLQGELRQTHGSGELNLQGRDAAQALRWLQQLPGLPASLKNSAASGNAELQASWQGGWLDPRLEARLAVPLLDWHGATPDTAKTSLAGLFKFRDLKANLTGRLSQARLSAQGRLELGQRRYALQLAAEVGRLKNAAWQGLLKQLSLSVEDPALGSGAWRVATRAAVPLSWMPTTTGGAFHSGSGEALLIAPSPVAAATPSQATIAWQPVRWRTGELISAGTLTGLPLAWIELLAGPQMAGTGLTGNLVFNGQWDARLSNTLALKASLSRSSGDLTVQAETAPGSYARVAAGVKQARISLTSEGDAVALALRWDSERAGTADVQLNTRLARAPQGTGIGGWLWPLDAPLNGRLLAQLPRIGVWSVLAPPGWRLRGSLDADIAIAGNRSAPQLSGELQANDLALRSVVDGIEFGNGRLRARLDGSRLRINEFTLQGAGEKGSGGLLTAQGEAGWIEGRPQVLLNARLQQLRASLRTDRQITLSGEVRASLQGNEAEVNGTLVVDRARIVLPDESTPQLGDDVVVRSTSGVAAGQKAPAQANAPVASSANRPVKLAVQLNLGQDFRIQGKGIDTRVRGTLALKGESLRAPRLTGTVTTTEGQYRAYGQRLDIEQGVLRFTGPLDNPTLDILAIRPNLTQRVGVQITGTALLPRVRLYAEPDLPEAEKLSWLVIGRPAAAGGAEAALLQEAALALLGSKSGGISGGLAASLGLDELSFRNASSRADGSTNEGSITLGKRFSRNFYAAYERSLSGALGTLYVFYDLSQRFTVRAQAGQQSAVDLIFTVPYD